MTLKVRAVSRNCWLGVVVLSATLAAVSCMPLERALNPRYAMPDATPADATAGPAPEGKAVAEAPPSTSQPARTVETRPSPTIEIPVEEGPSAVAALPSSNTAPPPAALPPLVVAAKPRGSAPAVAALPKEPPINDDPQQLIGLDQTAVAGLLGGPQVRRREQPAEIWQYFGNDCIFDVFLYEEGEALKVLHVEARNEAAQETQVRPCLRALIERHRAYQQG